MSIPALQPMAEPLRTRWDELAVELALHLTLLSIAHGEAVPGVSAPTMNAAFTIPEAVLDKLGRNMLLAQRLLVGQAALNAQEPDIDTWCNAAADIQSRILSTQMDLNGRRLFGLAIAMLDEMLRERISEVTAQ